MAALKKRKSHLSPGSPPETDSQYVEGDIDGITLSVTSCANTCNVENDRCRSTEAIAMLAVRNVIRISGGKAVSHMLHHAAVRNRTSTSRARLVFDAERRFYVQSAAEGVDREVRSEPAFRHRPYLSYDRYVKWREVPARSTQ